MKRTQWNKLGDHPAVMRPKEAHLQPVEGMLNCGMLGDVLVREGDWIVDHDDGRLEIERTHDPRSSAFDGYYPDGYDDGDQSGTHAGKQPRMVNCEVCQTEGRILTSDGGPDEIDNGPCPAASVPMPPARMPAMSNWQSIDTAPKDGSHILACRIPIGIRVTVNTHPPTVVHWFDDGFYTSVNEMAPERPYDPTHWQPLDPLPHS